MSKRNVAFTRPDEPSFLKRMKEQIGYKEPDTIEAKRGPIQNIDSDEDSDNYEEKDDEKPQIVQLKSSDLTEEEFKKFAKEEAEKPADLNQRVMFKVKKKKDDDKDTKLVSETSRKPSGNSDEKHKKSKQKNKPAKNLLSFNEDEDGE